MAFENFLHAFDHAFRVDPVHDKKHARKEVIASVRAQRNTRASACDAWTKKTMYVSIHERERERERERASRLLKKHSRKKTFVLFHKTNKQVSLFCVLPKKKKNLSASPLRFEFLHDFQKLIVRLLPIFQAIFQVSQITQRVLFSRGVVHLRPLRGRRVQPVL